MLAIKLYKPSMATRNPDRPKVGDVFGILTIVGHEEHNEHGVLCFPCRCRCGNERLVLTKNLRSGNTRSCGCRSYMQGGIYTTGRVVGNAVKPTLWQRFVGWLGVKG